MAKMLFRLSRPGVLCTIVGLICWSGFVTQVKCDDGVDEDTFISPECKPPKEEAHLPIKCTKAGQIHSFSLEFFEKCKDKLKKYDIAIRDNPFEPKQACLIFDDLKYEGKPAETCVSLKGKESYVLAGVITLLLIVLLDIIGITVIIVVTIKDCSKSHPPPPPPPPPANHPSATSQPTVVIVQHAAPAPSAPSFNPDAE